MQAGLGPLGLRDSFKRAECSTDGLRLAYCAKDKKLQQLASQTAFPGERPKTQEQSRKGVRHKAYRKSSAYLTSQRSLVASAATSYEGQPEEFDKSQSAILRDSEGLTVLPKTGRQAATQGDEKDLKSWQKGWRLAQETAQLAWPLAWQLLALFAVCDGLNFLLVRFCHRITNEVTLRFLLPGSISPANIGQSLWYLTSNPDISNFRTGYLWVSGLMLVIMLPFNILLRTVAVSASQLLASRSNRPQEHPSWRPPIKQVWQDLTHYICEVTSSLSRLWKVDILVALRALPLQGLCLLVLPLPWAFPRLLNLQLASSLALFEGKAGKEAIQASSSRVQPIKKTLAYPFLGLLLTARLVAIMGETFFVRILSPRIAKEVPEIPLVVFLMVSFTTLALNRLSDLLPLVVYQKVEGQQGRALESSSSAVETA